MSVKKPQRIIMHWTAGTHKVSELDKEHYHFIIDGEGFIHKGKLNPEANNNTSDGNYAAHTRALNTGSIGVAVAAMHNAKERPFDAGSYPITRAQLTALAACVADLCDNYGIQIDRKTVLTHAEVQPTLGVKQNGKWDITWIPGRAVTGSPVEVGDEIRALVWIELRRLQDTGVAKTKGPLKCFLR